VQLTDAIINRMAKDNQFVPATHPTVTTAVRETERAIAHGLPMTIAVAFGVAKATGRSNHTLNQLIEN